MLHDASTQKALDAIPPKSKTVLYFSAPWCGPCQTVKPALEALSEIHTDANFVRVDVDADGDLARTHSVRGIPTVVVINADGTGQRLSGTSIPVDITKYL